MFLFLAGTDNYSFLIPVMKALIDKSYQLLTLDINLPNLPSTTMSPTFFDDFKTYCRTDEWTNFIENYVCTCLYVENSVLSEWRKGLKFVD